jgi:hypothetical protein
MIKISSPVPAKTRLPAGAWTFAALTTLASFFSWLPGMDATESYWKVAQLAHTLSASLVH